MRQVAHLGAGEGSRFSAGVRNTANAGTFTSSRGIIDPQFLVAYWQKFLNFRA